MATWPGSTDCRGFVNCGCSGLPSGLPAFASGLRVAAVFAPMGAIIGEWAGAKGGLAFIMLQSSNRMQADMMFAALILLAAMVLIMRFAVNRFTQFLSALADRSPDACRLGGSE